MAARGVGALIGPFLGRWLAGPDDRRLFTAMAVALAVFGIGYTTFGFMPTLLLAAPAVTLAHLGGGAQWTLSSYGLQRVVPDRIRGRIFAFDAALLTLTLAASALVTGWTATSFGARPTAVALGLVAIGWSVTWTWLTTDVRRATMIEGCGPAPELELVAGPEPAPR
jgi:MFS family permease